MLRSLLFVALLAVLLPTAGFGRCLFESREYPANGLLLENGEYKICEIKPGTADYHWNKTAIVDAKTSCLYAGKIYPVGSIINEANTFQKCVAKKNADPKWENLGNCECKKIK